MTRVKRLFIVLLFWPLSLARDGTHNFWSETWHFIVTGEEEDNL